MCLPALPVIAGATAAAGSLIGGLGALQQGNYESAVARQNAQLATEAARDSESRGALERRQFFRQVGQVKGQQVAAMAANGIDVGRGTAALIQGDTQALADEDANSLYANIAERTRGFSINAMNARAEAAAAKTRGRNAAIGSVFEAASSLVGGLSQQSLMTAMRQQQPLRAKFGW